MIGTTSSSGTSAEQQNTFESNKPIYELAEERLRELIQIGNLEAIRLAMQMRPLKQTIEVTC